MKSKKVILTTCAMVFCAFVGCVGFVSCNSDEENFGDRIFSKSDDLFLPENMSVAKTSLNEIPNDADILTVKNEAELNDLIEKLQNRTIVLMSTDNKILSVYNTVKPLANMEVIQNPEAEVNYGRKVINTWHNDTIRMSVEITADWPYLRGDVTMHSHAVSVYPRSMNYCWVQNNETTNAQWFNNLTICFEVYGTAYIDYDTYIRIPIHTNIYGEVDEYDYQIISYSFSWNERFTGTIDVPDYEHPNI